MLKQRQVGRRDSLGEIWLHLRAFLAITFSQHWADPEAISAGNALSCTESARAATIRPIGASAPSPESISSIACSASFCSPGISVVRSLMFLEPTTAVASLAAQSANHEMILGPFSAIEVLWL